jgi:hypothetical protein
MVSPATEIPIVIGSRYPWCRSVITPDAENDACLGVSKEMGCRIIEANVLYHSLLGLASGDGFGCLIFLRPPRLMVRQR